MSSPRIRRTEAALIIELGDGDRIITSPEYETKVRDLLEVRDRIGCLVLLVLALGVGVGMVAGALLAALVLR